MKANKLPSSDQLSAFFNYSDGNLYWKNRRGPVKAGSIVGTYNNSDGYYQVQLNKKLYRLHRLIYQLHYGDLLEVDIVDHIDGDKTNNTIKNLRKCSKAQNTRSRHSLRKDNTTGYRNVYKASNTVRGTTRDYWMVSIYKDGKVAFQKMLNIKKYSIEDANELAMLKRQEIYGEYAGSS